LAIQDESLHRFQDPYSYLIMLSPEDGSTAQVKRDQNYKLISSIIHLEDYYQPKQRAKAIDLVMANHKKHPLKIHLHFEAMPKVL
jgi:hypothetical protein